MDLYFNFSPLELSRKNRFFGLSSASRNWALGCLTGIATAIGGSIEIVQAQPTTSTLTAQNTYSEALSLYNQGLYSSSIERFRQFRSELHDRFDSTTYSGQLTESIYFEGAAGLELLQPWAIAQLSRFFESYPTHSKRSLAAYQLGKYYFLNRKFTEAQVWYRRADIALLTAAEAARYRFELGYAAYEAGDLKQAEQLFRAIKNSKSEFSAPANYYLGVLLFEQGNYIEAKESFDKVDPSAQPYAKELPYYNAGMLYAGGKYREVIDYLKPILASKEEVGHIPELNDYVGQAHYRLGDYAKAAPYLKTYIGSGAKVDQQSYFQLGYALQASGDCKQAIGYLEKAFGKNDSLSQQANYYVGRCQVGIGNKQQARQAFGAASNGPIKALGEEATFQHAKLTHELGPQADALPAVRGFLTKYPKSRYADEIKVLLSQQLALTRNYKEALEALESIKSPDSETKEIYQRVAYARATELYLDNQFSDAAEHYTKSLKYGLDPELRAESTYWRAECYAQLGQNKTALTGYIETERLLLAGAKANGAVNVAMANYGAGIVEAKAGRYDEALPYLAKANEKWGESSSTFRATAKGKAVLSSLKSALADAYFSTGKGSLAAGLYDEVIKLAGVESDYARYQRAILYGLAGQLAKKSEILSGLSSPNSKSEFADQALLERSGMALNANKFPEGVTLAEELTRRFPKSDLLPAAYAQIGLGNLNQNKLIEARRAYEYVIAYFPKSEEAREALPAIKAIYVELGDAQGYLDYAKRVQGSVRPGEADSLAYEIAESVVEKGKCDKSIPALSKYLTNYPSGYFVNQARVYRANCYLETKNDSAALNDYAALAATNTSYRGQALREVARIAFQLKRFSQAKDAYEALAAESSGPAQLEAQLGALRATVNIDPKLAETNARAVIAANPTPEQLTEARFYLAKALRSKVDTTQASSSIWLEAYTLFQGVSTKVSNAWAAESRYEISAYQFANQRYTEAQASIYELADKLPSYDYWVARGYLVLAECYVQQKDVYTAKAALKSLIDNYTGPVKIAAQKRYDELMLLEGGTNE